MARPAPPPLTTLPDPKPYRTETPGCHDCPSWTRQGATIGHCQAEGERKGWTTSYAYTCTHHPQFPQEG